MRITKKANTVTLTIELTPGEAEILAIAMGRAAGQSRLCTALENALSNNAFSVEAT